MSSEYYTLEEAANVLKLPTAEVNRLREKNSLRAFRDGSSWKFKKTDVDAHLAEIIKSRSAPKSAAESDFDLLSADGDDEAPTMLSGNQSFDSLMEDNDGLSLNDSKLISANLPASPAPKKEDDFEGLMIDEESDFSLSDDSSIVIPIQQTVTPPEKQAQAASASDVDLASDDLIPGSSVNLAGDSGISLLESGGSGDALKAMGSDAAIQFDDESDILSLVDSSSVLTEHTTTIAIPVEDDFQLTPDSRGGPVDESESGSQVIALDESSGSGSQVIALEEDSPFGALGTPSFTATPASGQPLGDSAAGFGGTFDAANPYAAPTGDFAAAVSPLSSVPARAEASYSPTLVTVLILTAFFLVLPGMMVLDLIIHIWSWGEPFVINSSMMDLFAGMAGLK